MQKCINVIIFLISIALTWLWSEFYLDMLGDEISIRGFHVVWAILVVFFIHIGLFLSVSRYSQEYKGLVLFLMMPPVILNMLMLPFENVFFSVLIGAVFSVVILANVLKKGVAIYD